MYINFVFFSSKSRQTDISFYFHQLKCMLSQHIHMISTTEVLVLHCHCGPAVTVTLVHLTSLSGPPQPMLSRSSLLLHGPELSYCKSHDIFCYAETLFNIFQSLLYSILLQCILLSDSSVIFFAMSLNHSEC